MTTLDNARLQMVGCGMPEFPPGHPVVADRIIRYGPKKRAWYILRELVLRSNKVVIVGGFGIWGQLDPQKIEIDWQGFSEEERTETKKKYEEAEAARARKADERAHLAANRARAQWDAARWGGESPYLKRKGVAPQKGLRHFGDGTLIVPMIDYLADPPALRGLQKIAPDGVKRYSSGMSKAGAMCRLGKQPRDGDPIMVAEGVATALSLREALALEEGKTPTVFVAFDCPNLAPAASALRKLYPASPIVFCADDDWQTDGNPGRDKAKAAARAIGNSTIVWPEWGGEREPKWTDFNDLHASVGLDTVRAQLRSALQRLAQGISTPKGASAKIVDEKEAWRERLLVKRGTLVDCRENVFWYLMGHEQWQGVIAFDDFANRVVKRKPAPWGGAAGEWTEADDARVGVWFVERERFSIKSLGNIMSAVMLAADEHRFHPVREHLKGLQWDGVPRVATWFVDYLGCTASEYVNLVGQFFLLNMIARVMEPGCIMRAVPVLEGPQERGKSTALAILGGEYFSDTPFRVGEADACLAIQGVWVYEIGEMQQFGRAEAAAVKQYVSSRVDRYRPPYGRRHINVPRQTVFAGSINEAQYLRDWTGNTRFHPVRCVVEKEIDLDGLSKVRDQLLAEALVLFLAGARRYPTRDEAERLFAPEQEARMQEAAWEEVIIDWLAENQIQQSVTVHQVLVDGVKVEKNRVTDQMMAHVGRILARLGWKQSQPRVGGKRKRVWARPDSEEKTKPPQREPGEDEDDLPF